MEKLEKKLLVTNESKGKGHIIVGSVLGVIGAAVPIGSCTYQICTSFNLGNITSPLIAGGVIAGIGLCTTIYGRIKHWYWNS